MGCGRRWAGTTLMVAGLAAASLVATGCTSRTDTVAPLLPAGAGLSAQAWVVAQPDVPAFIKAHGGPAVDNYLPHGSDPAAVLRLSWTRHDELPASVYYNVVVLDPSGEQAAINMQTSAANGRITIGWDSRFGVLSERYKFLAGTRGLGLEEPEAVEFRPNFAGPLWIIARFPPNGAMGIAGRNEVPIVGAFLTGADERIWWAEQLTPPSAGRVTSLAL